MARGRHLRQNVREFLAHFAQCEERRLDAVPFEQRQGAFDVTHHPRSDRRVAAQQPVGPVFQVHGEGVDDRARRRLRLAIV